MVYFKNNIGKVDGFRAQSGRSRIWTQDDQKQTVLKQDGPAKVVGPSKCGNLELNCTVTRTDVVKLDGNLNQSGQFERSFEIKWMARPLRPSILMPEEFLVASFKTVDLDRPLRPPRIVHFDKRPFTLHRTQFYFNFELTSWNKLWTSPKHIFRKRLIIHGYPWSVR